MRVLIVDENVAARMQLVGELREKGYECMESAGLLLGAGTAKRAKPHIAVATVNQDDLNSFILFCRESRKKWGEDFPIIALSVSRMLMDISTILDAGANDCLPIPPPVDTLAMKINRRLDRWVKPWRDDDAPPPALVDLIEAARARGMTLGDLADIYPGAAPRQPTFRRMAAPDMDWRKILTGVQPHCLERTDAYVKWSRRHLFRMPEPREYNVQEKAVLRRSGPPLAAALDRSGLPVGQELYSIVPRTGITAGFIVCLLNSRMADFYFNKMAPLPDAFLRIADLRAMPVPVPGGDECSEFSRISRLLAHFGPFPRGWADRQRRQELADRAEELVFGLYGADEAARVEMAALHF